MISYLGTEIFSKSCNANTCETLIGTIVTSRRDDAILRIVVVQRRRLILQVPHCLGGMRQLPWNQSLTTSNHTRREEIVFDFVVDGRLNGVERLRILC